MKAVLVLAVVACFVGFTAGVAVMSIDLGAEFIKIAIVKPGVPMEIVLNKESSRKTRAIVTFRDGERQFANQAYTTAVRFPEKGFWYLTHIIGRHFDDPQVQLYRERFPYYNLIKDEERGTVLFKVDEETTYSPDELLGMLIESCVEYAELFADHPIKDAVITVPAYFNQAERRAVKNAAKMVGLNVLQLMSNNAAVALNYGVFRRKSFNSTMQYYIFYDMGATSSIASVVGYQVVKMKDGTRMETNPQVVIKGVGFDRTLGGLDVSLRLRDHLARTFNSQKKTKTDVFSSPRAMAKLLKEAERVKQILSANLGHYVQVEGLLDEQDFKMKVTRAELEQMCSDIFTRSLKPLEEALKVSEITLGEITDVILMGGGTRLPKIQEELMKFLGRTELGKSINTDEAAAMGAVYQAAFLAKGFKVKTFGVKEANIYPIVVKFEKHRTGDDGVEVAKTITRTLFGRMNPFPQKKVMTFNKHFSDFSFNVGYGDLTFLSESEKQSFRSLGMSSIALSGVEDAYKKHGEGSESKGIKAHFRMDENGILNLDKVESVFEKAGEATESKDESAWSRIGTVIGGMFGSSDDKEGQVEESQEQNVDEQKEETTEGETKEESDEKSDEKSESKKDGNNKKDDKSKDDKNGKKTDKKEAEKEEPAKPKSTTIREEISVVVEILDLPNIANKSMKASKKKLAALKAKDEEKEALEKIRNELEAYIFDCKDKLYQDVYTQCSTEEQREKLIQEMSEASDWLDEQADDTLRDVFTTKLRTLKESMSDLARRVFEIQERPRALEALKEILNHSKHFLKSVKNFTNVEDPIFTEVEVQTLEKLINSTKDWRKSIQAEQAKLKDYENPKLLIEDVAMKIQALDREVKYLVNKAKYWKPKPKPKIDDKKKGNSTVNGTSDSSTDEKKTKEDKPKTKDEDSKAEGEAKDSTTKTPESQEKAPPESKDDASKSDDKENVIKLDGTHTVKEEHTEL